MVKILWNSTNCWCKYVFTHSRMTEWVWPLYFFLFHRYVKQEIMVDQFPLLITKIAYNIKLYKFLEVSIMYTFNKADCLFSMRVFFLIILCKRLNNKDIFHSLLCSFTKRVSISGGHFISDVVAPVPVVLESFQATSRSLASQLARPSCSRYDSSPRGTTWTYGSVCVMSQPATTAIFATSV